MTRDDKKRLIIVAVFFLVLAVAAGIKLAGGMPEEKEYVGVPAFPSYDWSSEDTYYLAVAAANRKEPIEKEKAVIEVLDGV